MEKKVKPLIKSCLKITAFHPWLLCCYGTAESSIRLSGATKGGDGALMTLISKPGLGWKLVHVQINWRSPSMTENYMWPKSHTALYKSCARSHVVSWSHTCILSHEWTNTPGAHCIISVHVALCSWYDFSMSLLCENSPCQQLEQCMRSYTYVSVQRHAETPQGRHLGDISNMFMHFIRSALQQWIGCK